MTAIIISFNYEGKLPSCEEDILHAVEYLTEQKMKIYLFTDSTIVKKIPTLSEQVIYKDYTNLLTELKKIHAENMVFYYSGHGEKEGMRLPNDDIIDWNDLRSYFSSHTSDVVAVIDCCYPPDFLLRYKCVRDINSGGKLVMREQSSLISPMSTNILTITSSGKDQKSASDGKVSLFTKKLFTLLREGYCSPIHILDIKIPGQQVHIYTSGNVAISLPIWLIIPCSIYFASDYIHFTSAAANYK